MVDAPPSVLSHISIGTNDFDRAVTFYDRVLPTIGCRRVMAHERAVAYGRAFPEFWVQAPIDGGPATVGNGTHVGFLAGSREAVDAFHAAALAEGGSDAGAPGLRDYTADYYAAFVRDPDGNKLEAVHLPEVPFPER
jgi:catechol 2,3-dioxygenase-like lactoylglutathione lyase family enzyme